MTAVPTEKIMASKPNKKAKPQPSPWPRLIIAVVPGYIATVIISSAFTALLPLHRAEATALSLFIAALVYTFIFIYTFAVSSWWRALRDILIATVIFGIALILRRGFFI